MAKIVAEFIELTRQEIPDDEVIALNENNACLVGFIEFDKRSKSFICESEGELLENVTHFAHIPKLP